VRLLRRYLVKEILGATAFVFAALVSLFAFMDFVRELKDLGAGAYRLQHIAAYVLLSIPGHIYELFPIAALIGALFALAQLAGNSEYTVMRTSGVSLARMAVVLVQTGFGFAVMNFLVGEFLAPPAEQAAQHIKVRATSGVVASDFRSGLWVKERSSFVNVRVPRPDATLVDVRIYEFDGEHKLRSVSEAKRGSYQPDGSWRLENVVQTLFEADRTVVRSIEQMLWQSVLSPDILKVLLVEPEQRSARDLVFYIEHLRESRQQLGRYETALWTKFTYPLAVIVMMLLALPFAQVQRRAGSIGAKVFAGIMLGIAFHLVNRLVGYTGSILEWPAPVSASLPSLIFLGMALSAMVWLERR